MCCLLDFALHACRGSKLSPSRSLQQVISLISFSLQSSVKHLLLAVAQWLTYRWALRKVFVNRESPKKFRTQYWAAVCGEKKTVCLQVEDTTISPPEPQRRVYNIRFFWTTVTTLHHTRSSSHSVSLTRQDSNLCRQSNKTWTRVPVWEQVCGSDASISRDNLYFIWL